MDRDKSAWVKDQNGFHYCAKCGYDASYKYNTVSKNYYENLSPYCPMCGRSMSIEEDD